MADIRTLNTSAPDFMQRLDALLAWESVSDTAVNDTVNGIIADIRARGDAALLEYTRRFDGWEPASAAELALPAERLEQAWTIESNNAGSTVWALYNAATRWSTHTPVRQSSEPNRASIVLDRERRVRQFMHSRAFKKLAA